MNADKRRLKKKNLQLSYTLLSAFIGGYIAFFITLLAHGGSVAHAQRAGLTTDHPQVIVFEQWYIGMQGNAS
jgi:hypothetical protein